MPSCDLTTALPVTADERRIPSTPVAAVKPGVVRLQIHRTLSAVEELRDTWSSWAGHPDSDIDVYLSLFKCRPDFLEPYVIVLYRDDRPDALLAARLVYKELSFKLGYKRVLHRTIRALNVPYRGLRGSDSADNCRAICSEVRGALSSGCADAVIFEPLRVDSDLYAAIHQQSSFWSRELYPSVGRHCCLSLTDPEAELRRIRSKIRVKSKLTKLVADFGEFSIRSFSNPDEIDEGIRVVEEIAGVTYQRALGVGFAAENAQVRELIGLGSLKGWLRIHVLYIAGVPAAYVVANIYDRAGYLNFTGFDTKYARYSPGALLLFHTIEEASASGMVGFDFGIGDARYKDEFSNNSWHEGPVWVFRPSLKGLFLNLARTMELVINRGLKQALLKAGLLERSKRLLRNRVTEKVEREP